MIKTIVALATLSVLLIGCDKNADDEALPYASRYTPLAGEMTLLRGATVLTGSGDRLDGADVLFADGTIVAVGTNLEAGDASVVDASDKWITPGIIDVHSHLGVYPSPGTASHSDGNEMSAPVTAQVWAEHSVWPHDPGFVTALAGGVTSMQILPGSANLIGGRSVTVKNVPGRNVMDMKFPGAPYGLKMACGENPKRVYGGRGQAPGTRMGNVAGYRGDEMSVMLEIAKEFGYTISAFHHAVEAYKIADLLAEADTCSAMWADWWGFKMEAYDGIRENAAIVDQAGACAIIHSDDSLGIQRLNQETAKVMGAAARVGVEIPPERAIQWITINAAKSLGIADVTGTLETGKMADVVLWDGNPFSVYSKPERVYIDGALAYERGNNELNPVTDFTLGTAAAAGGVQ